MASILNAIEAKMVMNEIFEFRVFFRHKEKLDSIKSVGIKSGK